MKKAFKIYIQQMRMDLNSTHRCNRRFKHHLHPIDKDHSMDNGEYIFGHPEDDDATFAAKRVGMGRWIYIVGIVEGQKVRTVSHFT